MRKGKTADRVSLLPKSSSCLVTLNGESRLLVSRDGLLDLIDTFRTLLQGE